MRKSRVYILIDNRTASSAEIFAHVIRQYSKEFKVVVVGDTPSYGVLNNAGLYPFSVENGQFVQVPVYRTGFPQQVIPDISNEEFIALNPNYAKIFDKK